MTGGQSEGLIGIDSETKIGKTSEATSGVYSVSKGKAMSNIGLEGVKEVDGTVSDSGKTIGQSKVGDMSGNVCKGFVV